MIDGNIAMNSHFENMSEQDMNDMHDHFTDQQQIEGQPSPKMSDELAAQSDVAAIEYGKLCDRFIGNRPYDNSHIVEAHERGQIWMYRKLTETKASPEQPIHASEARRSIPDGYDDWCEAHQSYYKDECPECVNVSHIIPLKELSIPEETSALFILEEYAEEERDQICYYDGLCAMYHHLHSLPPSPVGEAVAFVEWVNRNATWSSEKYKWLYYPTPDSQRAIWTTEELYALFAATQPAPSRAGEISPVLRWVKASERLPEAKSNIFFKYSYPGYPIEKLSGSLIDYSNDEQYFVAGGLSFNNMKYLEWLEEIPSTPAPEVKEEAGSYFRCKEPWPRCPTQCPECKEVAEPVKDNPVDQEEFRCLNWFEQCHVQCESCKSEDQAAEQPAHVPDTLGDITDANLKDWALAESKDLAQRDKDFFFMGVGHLYERLKPQIATLTQQRDAARTSEQKLIDDLDFQSVEIGEYRKALESWKFTLTGSTGQSAAYLQAMAILAKYPSLDKNQTNE